ncbi:MAG: NAD-dependent epimerase/dehydratase family protein, partial [Sphingomonadales bacterium]|nr:NAD-dependent epimerase/dehydratase family protein [Sphingomonadales bacterium]
MTIKSTLSALVTGYNGQDSTILIPLLVQQGFSVLALSRSHSSCTSHNGVSVRMVDPRSPDFPQSLAHIFSTNTFDLILHLAAANHSAEEPSYSMENLLYSNIHYTEYILEYALRYQPQSKVFIAGSVHQYSNHSSDILYVDDSTRESPRSPYGLTKSVNRLQARRYRNFNLPVYFGLLFNHESIYKSPSFVFSKLCKLAAHVSIYKSRSHRIPKPGVVQILNV